MRIWRIIRCRCKLFCHNATEICCCKYKRILYNVSDIILWSQWLSDITDLDIEQSDVTLEVFYLQLILLSQPLRWSHLKPPIAWILWHVHGRNQKTCVCVYKHVHRSLSHLVLVVPWRAGPFVCQTENVCALPLSVPCNNISSKPTNTGIPVWHRVHIIHQQFLFPKAKNLESELNPRPNSNRSEWQVACLVIV